MTSPGKERIERFNQIPDDPLREHLLQLSKGLQYIPSGLAIFRFGKDKHFANLLGITTNEGKFYAPSAAKFNILTLTTETYIGKPFDRVDHLGIDTLATFIGYGELNPEQIADLKTLTLRWSYEGDEFLFKDALVEKWAKLATQFRASLGESTLAERVNNGNLKQPDWRKPPEPWTTRADKRAQALTFNPPA